MDIKNIPDTNYIHIERWMYKLGLNMTEIAVYACIHGFCQDGVSVFTGSYEYLQAWAGCSRSTVFLAVRKMTDMKLIGKKYVMYKGKPYPTLYTVRSREMYSDMASMNLADSVSDEPVPMSLKIGLESGNKTDTVQKSDSVSPKIGPNNIANNIFKNAAEESEETAYESAAAAIISQKISESLGSDPYPKEFLQEIEDAVLNEGLSDKDIADYVSFACERAKSKNPKNIYGLFRTIGAAADVIADFKNGRKTEEKKAEELYECPVCHQKHSKYLDSCIRCGLSIGDRNNQEKISQQKQIYELPEDVRNAFRKECEEDFLKYDFRELMNPKIREKRNAEQREIYKKYGIAFIEGEF